MEKLSAWLFLLIAVLWLLPLVGFIISSLDVHTWIATIALAVIAIVEIIKNK